MATKKKRRGFFKFLVDCAYSLVSFAVPVMLVLALMFSFVLRSVMVDGYSMQDTLQNRDRMVLFSTLYVPQRGDVVVANRLDKTETKRLGVSTYKKPIIKRVIGIAGDVVEVTKDAVFVNGAKLSEPYVHYENSYPGVTYVPEGTVFVMGDHRNASTDSRLTGPVALEDVMGRVVARLNSVTDIETLQTVRYNAVPAHPSDALMEKAAAAQAAKEAKANERKPAGF